MTRGVVIGAVVCLLLGSMTGYALAHFTIDRDAPIEPVEDVAWDDLFPTYTSGGLTLVVVEQSHWDDQIIEGKRNVRFQAVLVSEDAEDLLISFIHLFVLEQPGSWETRMPVEPSIEMSGILLAHNAPQRFEFLGSYSGQGDTLLAQVEYAGTDAVTGQRANLTMFVEVPLFTEPEVLPDAI